MTIKKQLVKRNIAGDVILVPVGDSSLTLKGLITLNETAEFIWDRLADAADAADAAELAAAMCEEYDIDAATAKNDVDEILAQFRELEII